MPLGNSKNNFFPELGMNQELKYPGSKAQYTINRLPVKAQVLGDRMLSALNKPDETLLIFDRLAEISR